MLLRELQLLPSCSAEVLHASESVSLELAKALSLVARTEPREPRPRPTPRPAKAAPQQAPAAVVPPLVPPPSASPPRAPDTPHLPLAEAVRAATAAAPEEDFLPPWLANKNRQKQSAAPQLAPQDFPSLSGGAVSSPAAGAWGRGRPPALAARPQVRGSGACVWQCVDAVIAPRRHQVMRCSALPQRRSRPLRPLAALRRAQLPATRHGDSATASPERCTRRATLWRKLG